MAPKKIIVMLLVALFVTIALVDMLPVKADSRTNEASKEQCRYVERSFVTFADSTLTYSLGESGMFKFIIIDSNGTDTAYNVDIIVTIDGVNYTAKTYTCSSASEPYKLVISSQDESANIFGGMPFAGEVKVRTYNGDGLDACKVILIGDFPFRP